MRFMRGPSCTYASETYSLSTSTSSERFCALAMADFSTFSTVGAMRLLVVFSVVIACPACWPRIKSTTSRAFCGETRMYLASALASMSLSPRLRLRLRRLSRLLGSSRCCRRLHRVPLELPGRRKLAQLVPHHVLGDVNRDELLAVVHGDGVPHELRQDGRAPRPGADHLLFSTGVHLVHLLFEVAVGEWSLFYRASHVLVLRLPVKPC